MIGKQDQVEVKHLIIYIVYMYLLCEEWWRYKGVTPCTCVLSPLKPSTSERIHSNTGSCSDSVLTPAALASDHWMSCQSTVGLSLWLLLIDEDCSEHVPTDHQTECNLPSLCQYRLVQLFQPHLGSKTQIIWCLVETVGEWDSSHQVHQTICHDVSPEFCFPKTDE